MRLGVVIYLTVRFGAVFRNRNSYGAVRRGSSLNVFFCGAVSLPVGKTVQRIFFSTAHRVNEPYKTAVSYGSHAGIFILRSIYFFYFHGVANSLHATMILRMY